MILIEPLSLPLDHPAHLMVEAFASVGVSSFDISFTDALEKSTGFRPGQSPIQLHNSLKHFVARAEQDRNVILRPKLPVDRGVLAQLDDVQDPSLQQQLERFAFLTIETSPGNRQLWLAIADPAPDTRRRLKKTVGADPHASGAVRLAGTANRKPKYAPQYPIVRLVARQPGRIVTRIELEFAGLLPELKEQTTSLPTLRRSPKRWPSYDKVLQGSPRGGDLGEQRYAADFTFAMIAIDWGWSVEETATRLLEESSKAQENGEEYAHRTARNAASAVARRAKQQKQ